MWYAGFTALCVVLAAFGAPHRRGVWLTIACASMASMLMGSFLDGVNSSWKLLAYAALEVVTVSYLLTHSDRCRALALWQSVACSLAWAAHVLLFIDVEFNADVIYSNYESAILLIAALQLIPAADELNELRRGIWSVCFGRGVGGVAGLAPRTDGVAVDQGRAEAQKP